MRADVGLGDEGAEGAGGQRKTYCKTSRITGNAFLTSHTPLPPERGWADSDLGPRDHQHQIRLEKYLLKVAFSSPQLLCEAGVRVPGPTSPHVAQPGRTQEQARSFAPACGRIRLRVCGEVADFCSEAVDMV